MPVKWTPENDLLLLIKFLETHPFPPVDANKITSTWPSTATEVPTPRAVRDRIRTLRNTYNSGLKKENGDSSSSSTPASKKAGKNISRSGKEKRRVDLDKNDPEGGEHAYETKNGEIHGMASVKVKKEREEEEGEIAKVKKESDMQMPMEPLAIDDDVIDYQVRPKKRKAPGSANARALQGWEATTTSAKMVVEKMIRRQRGNGGQDDGDVGEDNGV